MGRKPRHVGTCGIYLVVAKPSETMGYCLVHRKPSECYDPNRVAAPGGCVERALCGENGNFALGAKRCAMKELFEESGLALTENEWNAMFVLDSHNDPYYGPATHLNFCVVLRKYPSIQGPVLDSVHEIVRHGMRGVGKDAGDGFHAWVRLDELFVRHDLMQACREPVKHLIGIFKTRSSEVMKTPRTIDPSVFDEPVMKAPRIIATQDEPLHAVVSIIQGQISAFREESVIQFERGFMLPTLAVFDLDHTLWHDALDRKRRNCAGPPFRWSHNHRTVCDSDGTPIVMVRSTVAAIMALHAQGVRIAIASHSTRAAWCNDVLDTYVVDDYGKVLGDFVAADLRIISQTAKYYKDKNQHLQDIGEKTGAPLSSVMLVDDDHANCKAAVRVGAFALRVQRNGFDLKDLFKSLQLFNRATLLS